MNKRASGATKTRGEAKYAKIYNQTVNEKSPSNGRRHLALRVPKVASGTIRAIEDVLRQSPSQATGLHTSLRLRTPSPPWVGFLSLRMPRMCGIHWTHASGERSVRFFPSYYFDVCLSVCALADHPRYRLVAESTAPKEYRGGCYTSIRQVCGAPRLLYQQYAFFKFASWPS